MTARLSIRDNAESGSYEALIDAEVVGVVVYKRVGDRVVIRHTVVEPQFRGSGVGRQLVRTVLDELRARGDKLTNYCGFVTDFIEDNPDYRGLVDLDQPGVTLPRNKRGKDGIAPPTHR